MDTRKYMNSDELKNLVSNTKKHSKFKPQTRRHLEEMIKVIALAEQLNKEVEWLYDKSISENVFLERMQNIQNEFNI